MTVRDLINWCEEHNRSYDTEVYLYVESKNCRYAPAKILNPEDNGIFLSLGF